jgi:hypothetical protein
MMIFLFWIALSVAVGMFASIRRNRNGIGWFFAALIFSPLLAGIFVAIARPREDDLRLSNPEAKVIVWVTVTAALAFALFLIFHGI